MTPSRSPSLRPIDPARVDAAAPAIDHLDGIASHRPADHAGCRVYWRCWGRGEPVILIHGGHGSWLHWLPLIEPLSRRHQLWIPDLPGYGDSDRLPGDPRAPERQQALVAAVAATWRTVGPQAGEQAGAQGGQQVGQQDGHGAGGQRAGGQGPGPGLTQRERQGAEGGDRRLPALVGFSFGGLVCGQLIAAGLPVRRLALIGTAAHGTARRPMADLVNWRFGDRTRALTILDHNLRALMLHDPRKADPLALLIHERCSRRTRYRSRDLSKSGDLAACLVGFAGPLRLIWGEHDVTAADPVAAAARLAGAIAGPAGPARNDDEAVTAETVGGATEPPGVDLRIIAGAGHWCQYEAPAPTLALLDDWLLA